MLTNRIIPCLDVKNGRVVKGIKFMDLKDAGDPLELAKKYEEQGADEIIILDISATLEERLANFDVIKSIRKEVFIPICVGGGIKNEEDASALLDIGADKVSINSAAVLNPLIIKSLSQKFGRQCIVLAVDAVRVSEDRWQVVINSGTKNTELDVVDWTKKGVALGAGEILLTSLDKDGTKSGYDLNLIKKVCESVDVPIIASGGASSSKHFVDGINAGASAVLAASIFHYGEYTVKKIKQELKNYGVEVRI